MNEGQCQLNASQEDASRHRCVGGSFQIGDMWLCPPRGGQWQSNLIEDAVKKSGYIRDYKSAGVGQIFVQFP